MRDYNIIKDAEDRLSDIDEETIGFIYDPEGEVPEDISEIEGIGFRFSEEGAMFKVLPMNGTVSKEWYVNWVNESSWGIPVEDCEKFLSNLKSKRKNKERKLRRKGN